MAFYELQPAYLCRGNVGVTDVNEGWYECGVEDFCGNESGVEHRIDETSMLSLSNWVEQYEMTCAPKYQFGLFGSLFFIAVVISSLIFTPLADKYGRRPLVLSGLAFTVAG